MMHFTVIRRNVEWMHVQSFRISVCNVELKLKSEVKVKCDSSFFVVNYFLEIICTRWKIKFNSIFLSILECNQKKQKRKSNGVFNPHTIYEFCIQLYTLMMIHEEVSLIQSSCMYEYKSCSRTQFLFCW